VDADEGDRAELNEWIDQLDLGNFISGQIKRPADEWLSHVASTRSKALLMIRILPDMDKNGRFIAHQVEYLAVVMKNRLLLTYTTSESGRGINLSVSHESMEYMTQEELLFEGSSSAALIAWLEFHVLRTRKALTTLRKDALILAKEMDIHPRNVQLKDITDIGDNLLVVLSVAEEQAQCLAMIKNMDVDTHSVDFTNLRGALTILVKTAESTERMGQRLEKRAKGLKDTYDARQQDKLNRRLAVLTVVSTIFMPLTFIAGIYGMNFENMPELEYENSYFILIGVMVALTVGMVAFFYQTGWFS
jgi:Mg2+ and Co2+ transporter CorA